MKLDTEKKVLLAQKALYSKQLVHYKHLCEVYKKLADILVRKQQLKDRPDESIADQIQKHYGPYLSMAARGDLSFVQHNGTTRDGFIAPRFSPEQLKLFENYAKYSERVARFQEASSILQDATHHHSSFDISPEGMDEFEEFMQKDTETASFKKMLDENPKRWIGHIYYRRSVNAINEIQKIDPDHLTVLSKHSLTPKSFGAVITGARGRISPVKEQIKTQFKASYSDQEHEDFSKKVSLGEELGASAYRTGYHVKEKAKQFYTAHKGTLKKALQKAGILVLSLGLVLGASKAIDAAIDDHKFNNDVYMGSPAYVDTVNDETQKMMEDVDAFLTSLESSSAIPTADQLRQATEMVDNEGNIIMDNLIRNSFESQFPNLNIPKGGVTIQYDKSRDDKSDGSLGNFVYITCQDEHGKEYSYTIKDFRSQGENRIDRLFKDERNIDQQANTINNVYKDNYLNNSESAREYLEKLRAMHNNNVELAGVSIIINNAEISYDNAKANDSETLGDRIKLEFAKIFSINNMKTVAPEKAQTPETPTNTISGTEIADDDDAR